MKDNAADDTVIERLNWALEADTLPKAARDYAQHLLNRLSQPVRVSVLGSPKAGKSELINMFLGRDWIPKDAILPTTEFVWGEDERMVVTSADGAVSRVHHADLGTLSGLNAAFLRVEVPVPILRRINLLEVVTEGSPEELSSGVDWAVRRTDIALWCTQTFEATEQAVWGRVPDSLKDHAFLVLTKADLLSAENLLSKRVAALETVVAEEFHSMFAVATLQAIRAHTAKEVDEGMFHASGGGALTSEVLRHAERGRRADFDSAHMFLARYQVRAGPKSQSEAAPEKVQAEAPVVQPAAEAVPQPAEPTAAQPAPPLPDAAKPPPPEAPAMVAPITAANQDAAPKVENVELFSDAIRFLKRRGEGMAETLETLGEGQVKPLIDQCVSAVEHLVDLFSRDESGCEATDEFIDELAEAADMMVLMQIEDGDGPAADAISLLLQLRRDMEMQLAA